MPLSDIEGTGPEGRIVKADIDEYLGISNSMTRPFLSFSFRPFLPLFTVITHPCVVIHLPMVQLQVVKELLRSHLSQLILRPQLWTMLTSLILRYER